MTNFAQTIAQTVSGGDYLASLLRRRGLAPGQSTTPGIRPSAAAQAPRRPSTSYGDPFAGAAPFDPAHLQSLSDPGRFYGGSPTQATPAQLPGGGGQIPLPPPPSVGAPAGVDTSQLDSDPILQQIKASALRALNTARAGTLRQREQTLVGFGDNELARKVLGDKYAGLAAVTDNPDQGFSTLSRINHTYRDTVAGAEDELNKGNLFYGGWRGKELGDISYAKQSSVAQATNDVQGLLSGYASQDAMAEAAYEAQVLGGLQAAYDRMLNRLPQGTDPGTEPPGPGYTTGPGQPGTAGAPAPPVPGRLPGAGGVYWPPWMRWPRTVTRTSPGGYGGGAGGGHGAR